MPATDERRPTLGQQDRPVGAVIENRWGDLGSCGSIPNSEGAADAPPVTVPAGHPRGRVPPAHWWPVAAGPGRPRGRPRPARPADPAGLAAVHAAAPVDQLPRGHPATPPTLTRGPDRPAGGARRLRPGSRTDLASRCCSSLGRTPTRSAEGRGDRRVNAGEASRRSPKPKHRPSTTAGGASTTEVTREVLYERSRNVVGDRSNRHATSRWVDGLGDAPGGRSCLVSRTASGRTLGGPGGVCPSRSGLVPQPHLASTTRPTFPTVDRPMCWHCATASSLSPFGLGRGDRPFGGALAEGTGQRRSFHAAARTGRRVRVAHGDVARALLRARSTAPAPLPIRCGLYHQLEAPGDPPPSSTRSSTEPPPAPSSAVSTSRRTVGQAAINQESTQR
jgi:hypothetical protein